MRPPERTKITITVTIEGEAEDVLAACERIRLGKRSAVLRVRVPTIGTPGFGEDYYLPMVEGGSTQTARDHLAILAKQNRTSKATDERLERLIDRLGSFTS